MGMNATTLRLLVEKGMSAADILEIAESMEIVKDRTATERKRRQRAREASERDMSRVTSRRDTPSEVPPNDIYSNPPPTSPGDAEASQPLAARVVEAWNAGPGKRGATTAKPLDAGRRKSLSLRLKEHTEAEVFEAISNVAASDFHCGRNDRGWSANIGWLLKSPENFQKALELQPRKSPAGANCNAPTDLVQEILRRKQGAA